MDKEVAAYVDASNGELIPHARIRAPELVPLASISSRSVFDYRTGKLEGAEEALASKKTLYAPGLEDVNMKALLGRAHLNRTSGSRSESRRRVRREEQERRAVAGGKGDGVAACHRYRGKARNQDAAVASGGSHPYGPWWHPP